MSTLLLERSPALEEGFERDTRRRLDGALFAGTADAHGRLTLDDLITGVWEGLAVRTVNCPICDGPMSSDGPAGGHGESLAGTCLGCGTQLS